MWSNDDEIQVLKTMSQSKIIIGGISSFACLAGLIGNSNYFLLWHTKETSLAFGVVPSCTYDLESISIERLVDQILNDLIQQYKRN